MTLAKPLTKCPYCLEPIAAGATRCKHCQADLTAKKSKGSFAKLDTFRAGFLVGVLFSIILGVLIYGHFSWGG